MNRNKMKISLAGQDFVISSGSDEQYMRSLEAEINRRIRQIQGKFPEESTSRCTLLAMLELEDELKKLEVEAEEVDRKIKELRNLRGSESAEPKAPAKRPFERKKPVNV